MEFSGRKYRKLYTHLCDLTAQEWRASFSDVETVIGDTLPPSARRHRAWWSNHSGDNILRQARAWLAAGWETADVDIDAETLLFRREGFDAPGGQPASTIDALNALDQLQTALGAREVDLAGWARNMRAERRANGL